jgi:site-specific DNA-methyltransferase (adenine-specific)
VRVHSKPKDLCLDFFAGSGSFGEAVVMEGRKFVLVDSNLSAIHVMEERLSKYASPEQPLYTGDENILLK